MGILDNFKTKNSELKQAIVIRTDLDMGKGKIAAQAAHASLCSYLEALRSDRDVTDRWAEEGMKKIVLKVKSESELFQYFQQAKDEGLPVAIIRDAGLTQIESGSPTCFGIGPASAAKIDRIVGKLKLL